MHSFWNSVLRPLILALKPTHVLEVGAADGLVTHPLAALCHDLSAHLTVVDPFPRFDVAHLCSAFPRTTVKTAKSLEVLPTLGRVDLAMLDGDHNWYTVYHELQTLVASAGSSAMMPVTVVHDIGWPYGKRDLYYSPDDIPAAYRHPFAAGGLRPGESRLVTDGAFNHKMFHAQQEGGEKNGVGCAVDDFLAEHEDLAVVRLPVFNGLAIMYPVALPKVSASFAAFLQETQRSALVDALLTETEADRVSKHTDAFHMRTLFLKHREARWKMFHAFNDLQSRTLDAERRVELMEQSRSWRWTVWLRHLSLRLLRSPKALKTAVREQWHALGSPGKKLFGANALQESSAPAPRPEEVVNRFHAGASSLSVIVTARNNGQYLRECLQSILEQTVRPMEILYCDDGSTDDSVAIASSVRSVRVLARIHEGVVAARNAAVAESAGQLLLHVDGDDMLPPAYIATQLEKLAWNPDAVFVYGGNKQFGLENVEYPAFPWNTEALWRENFINTSSIVRRDAFLEAGGWRDTVGTFWDWDLWLRIARIGRGVPCSSMLLYRRHEGSWSQNARQLSFGDTGLLIGRTRRAAATIAVSCVYGGRVPSLLPEWFASLAASVKAHPETLAKPEVIILDNSDGGSSALLEKHHASHADALGPLTVIPHRHRLTWDSEMERRHKVCMFLAKAYNILLAASDADILWFLEDDVVVPSHAFSTLISGLTDGFDPPAAVSGLYRNRHVDDWVAHTVDAAENVVPIDVSSGEPMDIDLVGTGCLMIARPLASHPFRSHWRGKAQAHDWAWCDDLKRTGKKIILYPSVRCRHYSDSTSWI